MMHATGKAELGRLKWLSDVYTAVRVAALLQLCCSSVAVVAALLQLKWLSDVYNAVRRALVKQLTKLYTS